jgi:hypothetical protein
MHIETTRLSIGHGPSAKVLNAFKLFKKLLVRFGFEDGHIPYLYQGNHPMSNHFATNAQLPYQRLGAPCRFVLELYVHMQYELVSIAGL